jgi:hypothetical protein
MTKTNLHQATFERLNDIGKNKPNMKTALGLLAKIKITRMHQFFSTTIPEAKITIVSKSYHELKFNHHDLYYTPHNKGRFFYSQAT